jgi:hypothetical protein
VVSSRLVGEKFGGDDRRECIGRVDAEHVAEMRGYRLVVVFRCKVCPRREQECDAVVHVIDIGSAPERMTDVSASQRVRWLMCDGRHFAIEISHDNADSSRP